MEGPTPSSLTTLGAARLRWQTGSGIHRLYRAATVFKIRFNIVRLLAGTTKPDCLSARQTSPGIHVLSPATCVVVWSRLHFYSNFPLPLINRVGYQLLA